MLHIGSNSFNLLRWTCLGGHRFQWLIKLLISIKKLMVINYCSKIGKTLKNTEKHGPSQRPSLSIFLRRRSRPSVSRWAYRCWALAWSRWLECSGGRQRRPAQNRLSGCGDVMKSPAGHVPRRYTRFGWCKSTLWTCPCTSALCLFHIQICATSKDMWKYE